MAPPSPPPIHVLLQWTYILDPTKTHSSGERGGLKFSFSLLFIFDLRCCFQIHDQVKQCGEFEGPSAVKAIWIHYLLPSLNL